ncbi:folate family ECF transporter S component [Fusibacter ferrireducens]|uniref:Folate family ECF transporter S component n=1 Tax=Fusibacter ferrireducens TaxID=2785058 RepID=A0ABR9ZVM1_9FIRM|nr:folate family ECF transporter S component [Fusibacter ferrireducens]MBF4694036.1 folate family ECF transporter S component [Fusibacter ferrireducens]
MELRKKRLMSTSSLVKAALLAAISIVLTRVFSIMVPLGGLPALRVGFGNIPIILSGMLFGPLAGGITGLISDLLGYIMSPQGAYFPGFTLSSTLLGIIPGVLYKTLKIQKQRFNYNYVNAMMVLSLAVGIIWVLFRSEVVGVNNGHLILNDTASIYLFAGISGVALLFGIMPFWISKHMKGAIPKIGLDKLTFTVTLTYVLVSLLMNTYWLSIMFGKGFMIFLPGRVVAAIPTIPIYTFILYTLSRFVDFRE